MRRWFLVVVVLFVPGQARAATTDVMRVGGGGYNHVAFFYEPKALTIVAGDSVRWEMPLAERPLVSDDGQWSKKDSGPSYTHAFPAVGTFAYHCELHGDSDEMRGTVRVVAGSRPSATLRVVGEQRAGEPTTLNAEGSSDPDGGLTFSWDVNGDGKWDQDTGTAPMASVTYPSEGRRNVSVRVTDESGVRATATTTFDVGPRRAPGGGTPSPPAPGAPPAQGGDETAAGGAAGATPRRPRLGALRLPSLAVALRRGLRVPVLADTAVTGRLVHRGRTIARGRARARADLVLAFTRAARRSLARTRRISATLVVDAGDVRLRRTVTLRR